jgi:hypothetical protein
MRLFLLMPLLAIAACSGGEPTAKTEDAPAADKLNAGQWEMTTEVTKVTQRDKGTPAINMPEGSKTVTSSCLAEADAKKPQPAILAPEGSDCKYRDSYISGGRLNATLECTRAGLTGDISTAVNGSYTGDTIEATSTTETRLSGEGDLMIEAKLTGRRTGDCTAAPTAPAAKS